MSNELLYNPAGSLFDTQAPQAGISGNSPANINRRGNRANDGTQLPKAKFWANIGQYVTVGKAEDGVTDNRVFIGLPQGIALDTSTLMRTDTNNAEFNAKNQARNDLLQQLLAYCKDLEPGTSRQINLTVEVFRVADEAPVDAENNQFMVKAQF